ncbi:MAG TPA: DUF2203 domain-containing protein [Gaiellaceae bacterium]|nr:DUF2203 domain-containing protein [Gaiellaceae bacterium]
MSQMRLFTPEEANAELARLRPLLERVVEEHRALGASAAELQAAQQLVAGNGGRIDSGRVGGLQEAVSRAAAEVAGLVEELQTAGVQVKDLDRGLIDFPARHPGSGETVLLCFELGEPAVEHWHDLEEGFAGRKRLPF